MAGLMENPAADGFQFEKVDAARRYLETVKPWWHRFASKVKIVPSYRPPSEETIYGGIASTDQSLRVYLDRTFVLSSPIENIAGVLEHQYMNHARDTWRRLGFLTQEQWSKHANIAFDFEINSIIEGEAAQISMRDVRILCSRSVVFSESELDFWGIQSPPTLVDTFAWVATDFGLPNGLSAEEYAQLLVQSEALRDEPQEEEQSSDDADEPEDEPTPDAEPQEAEQDEEQEDQAEDPDQDEADADEGEPAEEQADDDADTEDDAAGDEGEPEDAEDADGPQSDDDGASVDEDSGEGESPTGDPSEAEDDPSGDPEAAQEQDDEGQAQGEGGEEGSGNPGGEPTGEGSENPRKPLDLDYDIQGLEVRAGQEGNGKLSTNNTPGSPQEGGTQEPGNGEDGGGEPEPSDAPRPSAELADAVDEFMKVEEAQMWANELVDPNDPLTENSMKPENDYMNEAEVSQGEIEQAFFELEEDINSAATAPPGIGIKPGYRAIDWVKTRRAARGVNWESKFSRLVTSQFLSAKVQGSSDMSYSVANPNQPQFGPILQGSHSYSPIVVVLQDVSASMLAHNRLARSVANFQTLCSKVLSRFGAQVYWVTVDTRVVSVGKTSNFGKAEQAGFKKGFGGTIMEPTITALLSGKFNHEGFKIPRPDLLIPMTDCQFNWPGRRPDRKTKFVVVSTEPAKSLDYWLPQWLNLRTEFIEMGD